MKIHLAEFLNRLQHSACPHRALPDTGFNHSAYPNRTGIGQANAPRRVGLCVGLALLASCLAAALLPLYAAPAAFPMQRGEVVVTGFSYSNPDGFNVTVIDVRN